MDLVRLLEKTKAHPDYPGVGMILCHVGVVRGTSRDGRRVSGLRLSVDSRALEAVLAEARARPGIIDVQAEIQQGDLAVGDVVMHLVVAGDIRDRVIPALEQTLNAIKQRVTRKQEHFIAP